MLLLQPLPLLLLLQLLSLSLLLLLLLLELGVHTLCSGVALQLTGGVLETARAVMGPTAQALFWNPPALSGTNRRCSRYRRRCFGVRKRCCAAHRRCCFSGAHSRCSGAHGPSSGAHWGWSKIEILGPKWIRVAPCLHPAGTLLATVTLLALCKHRGGIRWQLAPCWHLTNTMLESLLAHYWQPAGGQHPACTLLARCGHSAGTLLATSLLAGNCCFF